MTDTPMKTIVCCADHDHATDLACEIKAESVTVPLTEDEIAQQQADYAAAQAASEAKAAAEAATAALKASAKAKLIAGTPLTQEEADVLVL